MSTTDGKQQEAGTHLLKKTEKNVPLLLRITGKAGMYNFDYSIDGIHWQIITAKVDGTILSTQKAGGFTGCIIGMYAGK